MSACIWQLLTTFTEKSYIPEVTFEAPHHTIPCGKMLDLRYRMGYELPIPLVMPHVYYH